MSDARFRRPANNPGALISTDMDGLQAYKKKKRAAAKINTLESEVADIKKMLTLILEKLDK